MQSLPISSQPLLIIEDLYSPSSKVLQALQGNINPNETSLAPDDPDSMIFLAEVSFSIMSKWITVARFFSLPNYIVMNLESMYFSQNQEASFQMMLMSFRHSPFAPHVKLQHFLDALNNIGIPIYVQKLAQQVRCLEDMQYHKLPGGVVAKISERIASQWKFVGRMLGVSETDISKAAEKGYEGFNRITESTVAILNSWASRHGNSATLLKLRNVIRAIHEHSNHNFFDAVAFLTEPFQSEGYNG